VSALLAHLSDPHINVGPGDTGSADSLAAAVETVLAVRPVPDAVLVSGDIADGAFAAEYERAAELLAPLPMPVHVLPGNHDDRDLLREHFGCEPAYATRAGDLRMIVCDTAIPGRVEGRLDLAWLEAQLAEDAPTVVAMHHPPLRTGMPALDEIGLPEWDRRGLGALLARHPHVLRVLAGHTHRTSFEILGGCGVLTCPGTHMTARLEIGAADYEVVREPPAIMLHALLGGELVSHVQPI